MDYTPSPSPSPGRAVLQPDLPPILPCRPKAGQSWGLIVCKLIDIVSGTRVNIGVQGGVVGYGSYTRPRGAIGGFLRVLRGTPADGQVFSRPQSVQSINAASFRLPVSHAASVLYERCTSELGTRGVARLADPAARTRRSEAMIANECDETIKFSFEVKWCSSLYGC